MRFMGQNEKGQLLLDGEGETIQITTDIPNDDAVILMNFRIESVEKLPPERQEEIRKWAEGYLAEWFN